MADLRSTDRIPLNEVKRLLDAYEDYAESLADSENTEFMNALREMENT